MFKNNSQAINEVLVLIKQNHIWILKNIFIHFNFELNQGELKQAFSNLSYSISS